MAKMRVTMVKIWVHYGKKKSEFIMVVRGASRLQYEDIMFTNITDLQICLKLYGSEDIMLEISPL